MKVILLNDVVKLGKKYDIKNVNSGYALNFLIPNHIAVVATPTAIKKIELEKAKIEGERRIVEELLMKNIEKLNGVTVAISGKANDNGHLFAGLRREEIVDELMKQKQIQIDPSFIQLEHPIKELGEYMIEVKTAGKSAKFKLAVK